MYVVGFFCTICAGITPVDSGTLLYVHAIITNSDHLLHAVLFLSPPGPLPTAPSYFPQPPPLPYRPSFSFPKSGNAYIHADGGDIVIPYGLCWKFT